MTRISCFWLFFSVQQLERFFPFGDLIVSSILFVEILDNINFIFLSYLQFLIDINLLTLQYPPIFQRSHLNVLLEGKQMLSLERLRV
jgi:hypothetical protein